MARGVNKVIVIGNLGADPELRYTGSGQAVANVRLATNEVYTNADGERVEKTEWINAVAWGKQAEVLAEYAKKGSALFIEGSLQTRSWEDRDGNTRYTTEVKIREFQFLSSGNNNDGNGNSSAAKSGNKRASKKSDPAPEPVSQDNSFDFDGDYDLPF